MERREITCAVALALTAAVGYGQAQGEPHPGPAVERLAKDGVRKAVEDKEKRDRALREAMRNLERFEDRECERLDDDANTRRRNQIIHQNLVATVVRKKFEVPEAIPADAQGQLNADVQFRFDEDGKLVGQPRLVRSSGNKLFDDAALATLRKFAPGTPARIPVPPAHTGDLRKSVLKNGLTLTMDGNK